MRSRTGGAYPSNSESVSPSSANTPALDAPVQKATEQRCADESRVEKELAPLETDAGGALDESETSGGGDEEQRDDDGAIWFKGG